MALVRTIINFASAANDLHALYKKIDAQIGSHEASIFLVHESILRDAPLTNKIRAWIVDERMTASLG